MLSTSPAMLTHPICWRCERFIGEVCQTVIPPENLLPGATRHGVRCHLYDDQAALAGSTTGTITVAVSGDTLLEADETYTVNLSSPGNATINTNSNTGPVRDSPFAPL